MIVLDSSCDHVGGCGQDSDQGRWLADDLAASRATCTMAIWHHPRWSSGEHGSDPRRGALLDTTLYAEGRRTWSSTATTMTTSNSPPQDSEGPRGSGPEASANSSSGPGGATLRPFLPFLHAANSEVRDSLDHGVIRFVLHQRPHTNGRSSRPGTASRIRGPDPVTDPDGSMTGETRGDGLGGPSVQGTVSISTSAAAYRRRPSSRRTRRTASMSDSGPLPRSDVSRLVRRVILPVGPSHVRPTRRTRRSRSSPQWSPTDQPPAVRRSHRRGSPGPSSS